MRSCIQRNTARQTTSREVTMTCQSLTKLVQSNFCIFQAEVKLSYISAGRIIEIFEKHPTGKLAGEPELYLRLGMFYRYVHVYMCLSVCTSRLLSPLGLQTHTKEQQQLHKPTLIWSTGAVKVTLHVAACRDLHSMCSVTIETEAEVGSICGKCEVVCGEDIEGDKDDWFLAGPDRFYFFEVHSCCLIIILPS